jgi:hypothetical protein
MPRLMDGMIDWLILCQEQNFPGVFGVNSGSGLICSGCGAVFWGRRYVLYI